MYVHSSRPAVVPTLPPIQWAPRAFSLWVKWPGYEAGHSAAHPPDAEVKRETFMLLLCVRYIDKTSLPTFLADSHCSCPKFHMLNGLQFIKLGLNILICRGI